VNAIGALSTWGAYGLKGKGVKIAVLDTGADASHADLNGRVSDWAECDAMGNQVVGSTAHDSQRHGTHVSGTIAGGDASGQKIGVAPDAKLAVGLVLKGGSGTNAQILAGMEWAMNLGVDVISMSLGGLNMSPDVLDLYTLPILKAVRLGIPVVISIGNDGSQTSGAPGNDIFAFSVGATDYEDNVGGFSGGRTQIIRNSRFINRRHLPLAYSKPDVSAPGVAVQSCIPGGKWAAWNGTSMAAPHVAGALGLLLANTSIKQNVAPNQRAFLLQDLLTGSVEELGEAGQDHRYGFGRIDVLRAIGMAKDLGY